MTSLPVPVSPVIKTVVFVPATAPTWARIERRLPRRPTIVSRNEDFTGSGLRAVLPSPRYRTVFIDTVSVYGLGRTTEFNAVLIFCSCFSSLCPGISNISGLALNSNFRNHQPFLARCGSDWAITSKTPRRSNWTKVPARLWSQTIRLTAKLQTGFSNSDLSQRDSSYKRVAY